MSLTAGTAPFGPRPAGKFNFELPRTRGLIYFEDHARRIRARFAGETVVDSKRVKLMHESGHLPVYYFPEAEVRMDLLERTERTSLCPWKGEAVYYTVRVGDKVAANAAWSYPEPLRDAPRLSGYLAFYWDAMEAWLEEDELAIGHARDPYHRVDVLDTSRPVKVTVAGEVVAETTRARVLYETSLPPRWYIPAADVRQSALVPSDSRTVCAYKGHASYWSVRAGGALSEDLVWYYPEPRHEAARIKDYLCFYNEKVDLEIDGDLQERPRTPWSSSSSAPGGVGDEELRVEKTLVWPGK